MKRLVPALLAAALFFTGCSARRTLNHTTDISAIDITRPITRENAEEILRGYIIDFTIPNPLMGLGGSAQARQTDPTHEGEIDCRAVLLDEYSTEADILFNCVVDSMTVEACADYRDTYQTLLRDDTFRIMIAMESGFSDKSMEPDHWAMYLVTSDGVMVEPLERMTTPVETVRDSVYSEYYRRNFARQMLKRNITLYFPQETFFGEQLLDPENRELVFVISEEQRTVARISWQLSSGKERE